MAGTAIVMEHLLRLCLTLNDAKSQLIPVQSTVYLGLRLDSLTMRDNLSSYRVVAIQKCLPLFQQGSIVPLVLWLNAFRLHSKHDRHRQLTVSRVCWEAMRW
ncbi:UNVERIFIED_CONTAM: hypothetical protein FKN15_067074 [Acipenser sinensis]